MKNLHVGFLSPRPLNTREEAREFLEAWLAVAPELAPERFGHWEPAKQPFDVDSAVEDWGHSVILRRRKPSMDASVFVRTTYRQHTYVWVHLESGWMRREERGASLQKFVKHMAVTLQADFTYAHLLTEDDVEQGGKADTVKPLDLRKPSYTMTVSTHTLERFLPDLYWGTVFGSAYLRHFGRDRLLSAPAPVVEELPNGAVYLQLSDSPLDLRTRYVEVDVVRRKIKEHLNRNSFFDSRLHPSERDFAGRSIEEVNAKVEAWYSTHHYDTPTFEYEGTFPEPQVP